MKKLFVIPFLTFFLSACVPQSIIDLNQFDNVNIEDNKIMLNAEYGENVDLEEIQFALGKKGLNLSPIDIKTDKVGTETVDVFVDNRPVPITVEVKDTQAPKFSGKKEFKIEQNDKLNLNKHISAKDPVDGEVDIEFEKFDSKKPGKHKVKATATDKHDNKESITITITVEEKPKEVAAAQRSTTTNPTSQSNNSKPSSKPASQSKPQTESKPQVEATPAPSASSNRGLSLEMFNIVNSARSNNGVHGLNWSEELHRAANIRAKEIAQSFSHTRPNGSYFNTVTHLAYGENLAFGYRSPSSAHQGLMNSAGHRANILDTDFRIIGIGIYESNGTYYYAQLFGY